MLEGAATLKGLSMQDCREMDGQSICERVYAQSNLQLYRQLRHAAWPEGDLVAVDEAYRLAVKLFTGQFRSSGKPFLSHLVGTASILAHIECPVAVVVAGLLHASYAQGEWGDAARSVTDRRRQVLLECVGDEAAELIERYTRFPWTERTIMELRHGTTSLSESDVHVVVMRLANTLEDYLDLGMAYSTKGQKPKHAEGVVEATVDLAEALNYPMLATELKAAFEENRTAAVPTSMKSPNDRSFTVAPLSHHRRRHLLAVDLVRRGRGRIVKTVRSGSGPWRRWLPTG